MLTDTSREKVWSRTNEFTDVEAGAWYNNAVSTLANAKVIKGYPDGTFKPNATITRAEFAAIAASFYEAIGFSTENKFTDTASHWAKDDIDTAYQNGLVNGYPDGTYQPDKNITRAEAMTLMNNVLERAPHKDHMLKVMTTWPDNADAGAWYYEAVQEATNSHDCEKTAGTAYEVWTSLQATRNWVELEKQWADAYAGNSK